MKPSFSLKTILPDLLAVLTFIFFVFLYFSPLLQGKVLSMHDINMASGAAQELKDFHDKTGEWAWWTNSMFGGMPGYMIVGGYDYNLASKIGSFLYNLLPSPANLFLLLMLGFYLMGRVMKWSIWVAVFGAIAYAFGTYNLLYTEAGHISKILALAFIPGILAGVNLVFDKKYIIGAFITALFTGLELYANHLQITYYFFFVLVALVVFRSVKLFVKRDFSHLTKTIFILLISGLIGVGMHTQRLWSNFIYSAETIRGKSELTQTESGKNGLDKDYAFAWSYGINETFNLIIPDLMGGGSSGALDEGSETYRVLLANGVPASGAKQFIQNLPLYHGEQSVTSGPAYVGIVVFLFFVLGLFLLRGKWKWVHFGLVIFLIALSWGNHLPLVNYWFFDHFPGYNKFRAVSMLMTIVHFMLVWGAARTINLLLVEKPTWDTLKKPMISSLVIILVLFMIGYSSVNFVGLRDGALAENLKSSLGDNVTNLIISALRSDRESMAIRDIIRGIVFLLISSGIILFIAKGKLNTSRAGVLIILLVAVDLISVGKRYFNNSDFESKFKSNSGVFQPTAADQQILQDDSADYRVLNLATPSGFMSDARDSYFHKSLGGYHGAKLKKYNELVENEMLKGGQLNMGVINMLNTRYFITRTESGEVAQRNPGALGNAWFVDSLIVVPTADQELALTGSIDTRRVAVTQSSFKSTSEVFNTDSLDKIILKSYAPNKLVYESSSDANQFAVFSEIYYRGNKDWLSYMDGKKTDHIKVNYVLRGMEIPAGKHEIVFEFKPESVETGKMFDLVSSLLLTSLFGLVVFRAFRNRSLQN